MIFRVLLMLRRYAFWLKKPGEENSIKSRAMLIHPQSSICPVRSQTNPSDKWPGNQAAMLEDRKDWVGTINLFPMSSCIATRRLVHNDGYIKKPLCVLNWIETLWSGG